MGAEPAFSYAYATCASCGVAFGSPVLSQRQRDGASFYCPNGHSQCYAETEAARLRKLVEEKERALAWEKSMRQTAENGQRLAQKRLHRAEKRISNGVCPCCKRTVSQLSRHMKTKHPEYIEEHK